MKYYICEGTPDGEYNAQSKARNDAEKIFKKNELKPFNIPTIYGVQTNKLMKWKQLILYKKNYSIWKKYAKKLSKGDIIFIQYPLINTMLNFGQIVNYYKECGITVVMLVHDLDSIRFSEMPRKVKEDKLVLNNCDYIIAHNGEMKKKLIEFGNEKDRIIELEIFDYLFDKKEINREIKKDNTVFIAGNLSKEKAQYLKYLKDVKNVKFNLYGKGYEKGSDESNVNYVGAFLPNEVPYKLDGSFGLVWDGISKNTCSGSYGEYMKYNNPHKTSLYLASEFPVIVWEKSAISKFVKENNVGFVVSSLDEIGEKIEQISNVEYLNMSENVKEISNKLVNGYYLSIAINKVLKLVKENE